MLGWITAKTCDAEAAEQCSTFAPAKRIFEQFASYRRSTHHSLDERQHSILSSHQDVCTYTDTELLTVLTSFRLIPKADRKKIHEYIFREGVLVAKKDFNKPKHDEIDTKNLYVSARSRPR